MINKMNKIHNCDCLEFMKQVPDGYFDLVLTDPPYGIDAGGGVGGTYAKKGWKKRIIHDKKEWDKEIPSKEYFDEIQRISKNSIIFGGNYFAHLLPASKGWIYWSKRMGGNFSDGELAWTSFDRGLKAVEIGRQQELAPLERVHPTQKTPKLFRWILTEYINRENTKTIFDPFMGSGTTAIACKSLGLDWCGCELEADYCEIARKRLEAVQGSLF